MRKILLIGFIILTANLYGQRVAGGWAVQGKFGIMDGHGQMNTLFGSIPTGQATEASLGVSKILGNDGFAVEGNLFAQDYFVNKEYLNLPYRLYGFNAMGVWSYEDIYPIFLNFKLGLFAGYEEINNGINKDRDYGITFPFSVNSFTYGFVASPEIEVVLWRNLSLLSSYTQYLDINSKVSEWKFSLNLGLKYYFKN